MRGSPYSLVASLRTLTGKPEGREGIRKADALPGARCYLRARLVMSVWYSTDITPVLKSNRLEYNFGNSSWL